MKRLRIQLIAMVLLSVILFECSKAYCQTNSVTPISPKPQSVFLQQALTFRWDILPNAVAYHLQVSEDSSFVTTIFDTATLFTPFYTALSLPSDTQLYWRVRAFDGLVFSNWSVVFSLYLLTPQTLGNMQLWVRADSGTVGGTSISQWQDFSGNSTQLIQSDATRKPTWVPQQLNGLPALRFDGNDYLDGGQSLELGTNDQTILIVFNSFNANAEQFRLIQKRGHTTFTDGWSLAPRGFEWNSSVIEEGGQQRGFQNGCCMNDGNYRIVSTVWDNSEAMWDMHINSNIPSTTVTNSGSGILNGADITQNGNKIMTVGCSWNSYSDLAFFLNGNIAEIMVYHTALDSTERNLAEQYLRFKYAPPVNLGSNYPRYGFCDPTTLYAQTHFVSYQWSTGETTSSIQINGNGTYSVIATDIFGFTSYDEVVVDLINLMEGDTLFLCTGDSVIWNTQLSQADHSFQWQDGSTDSSFTITSAGNYWVVVQDTYNCFNSDSVTVIVNQCGQICDASFTYANSQNIYAFHNTSTGINVSYSWDFAEGNPPSTQQNPTHTFLSPGTYNVCLSIFDTSGCSDTTCTAIIVSAIQNLVWPGDANADGIANVWDVLAIGIGYGINGFTRPNATTNWVGQSSPDWQLQLAGGANLKHVDCDGNALIDSSDVGVIGLNYGLTHQKGGDPNHAIDPDLYFAFPQDSANTGDTIVGSIYLGTSPNPITNIYGIAFSLLYNSNIIDSGSLRIDFTDSWFTPNANRISLTKDLFLASKMDAGISRIDHTNISGAGKIADVSFVIQDNIDGKDYFVLPLEIQFENVLAIDKDEAAVSLSANGDTLYVKDEISSLWQINQRNDVRIFPNPAANQLYVVADFSIAEYRLLDLARRDVIKPVSSIQATNTVTIDLSAVEPGAYLIQLKNTGNYSVCRKIVVMK